MGRCAPHAEGEREAEHHAALQEGLPQATSATTRGGPWSSSTVSLGKTLAHAGV